MNQRISNLPTAIQAHLHNLFIIFDKFCREHDLHYVAAYGTVRDAVLYQKVKPWGDDIDVYMFCDDYSRLLKLKDEALDLGARIFDIHDKHYYLPFVKFCDNNTTILENSHTYCPIGVFIDVFPLGYADASEVTIARRHKYHYWARRLTLSAQHLPLRQQLRSLVTAPSQLFAHYKHHIRRNHIVRQLDIINQQILDLPPSSHLTFYRSVAPFAQSIYPVEWYFDTIEVPFEGISIRIPHRYHDYLTQCYGDYRTPPPPEQQKPKHKKYYINLRQHIDMPQIRQHIAQGIDTIL